MNWLSKVSTVLLLAGLIVGCAASTRFTAPSPAPETKLELLGRSGATLPRNERLPSKATGQHVFKSSAPGGEVLYGILPLRVNGGKMATSILFFAPALFIGGFRDVFAFYEIDPVERVIRYKSKESDPWQIYVPNAEEIERGRQSFAN